MNGSPTLEGYVPEIDATIVRRFSMPEAKLPAKPIVKVCACLEVHTRTQPAPSTTRTVTAIRQVDHPPAARHWWQPVKSIWLSEAIKEVRSDCPPPFVEPMA